MRRPYIDFMGNRKWLFLASGIVLTVAIVSLATKGLTLGYEFKGGTKITFTNASSVTLPQVRDAVATANIVDATVQTISTGYIVRSTEPSASVAGAQATSAMARPLARRAREAKGKWVGV